MASQCGFRNGILLFLTLTAMLRMEAVAQVSFEDLSRRFLAAEDVMTKLTLVNQVAALNTSEAKELLKEALRDSAVQVRIAAIEALGSYENLSGRNLLQDRWHLLHIPTRQSAEYANRIWEKAAVAAALAKLGNREHLWFVHDRLNDPDKAVRYNVVFELGYLGDQDAVNRLVDVLITEQEMVSYAALVNLIRLRKLDTRPETQRIIEDRSSYLLGLYPQ